MTNFSKLKAGDVLSESSYYTVVKVNPSNVILKNEFGEGVEVSKSLVEQTLVSGDQFTSEEVINHTQAAELFLNNPGIAMTINFNKKVDEKEVLKEVMTEISGAKLSEIEAAVKKAIKQSITGLPRTMRGRHFGELGDLGRVQFIDMDIVKDVTKSYDNRLRQTDPRTLNWMIIRNKKYTVK